MSTRILCDSCHRQLIHLETVYSVSVERLIVDTKSSLSGARVDSSYTPAPPLHFCSKCNMHFEEQVRNEAEAGAKAKAEAKAEALAAPSPSLPNHQA